MRPAPIPDEALWPDSRRIVMGPPDGDLLNPDIAPLEMVADVTELGIRYSARLVLEPGVLEKLAAGGHVWVSFCGHVVPFSVDVTDADGA